jgi:hypothetical protein
MRSFSRNRCTSVEKIDEQTLKSVCRLQDTLIDASVQIVVKLPDLEVTHVTGSITRSLRKEEIDVKEALQNVVGIRVGPGVKKIIKGVMGESATRRQLAFMVEECCSGVILSFTKDVLLKRPKDKSEERAFYAKMVKENPRLYNRCAAYAPGSSLVEGIEPPD